jgi:GNAT superfamily N-acetyltransferase
MEATDAVIVRVAPGVHWHALEDDVVVGRAHALHRPDGRVFLSVDTWRDDVFEALAEAMAQDLPRPLYTVVDDDDREHLGRWSDAGFRDDRREDVYAVPTEPDVTGLGDAHLPPGFCLLTADEAEHDRLEVLNERLRREVPGSQGWATAPAQGQGASIDRRLLEPLVYLIAVYDGGYAGLARIGRARMPRLGLIGVLPECRRRGVARALLAAAFRPLHERGVASVSAEVDEANPAARALLTGVGGERIGGAIELVRRT